MRLTGMDQLVEINRSIREGMESVSNCICLQQTKSMREIRSDRAHNKGTNRCIRKLDSEKLEEDGEHSHPLGAPIGLIDCLDELIGWINWSNQPHG